MHLDLAHALISAVLILATLALLRRFGIAKEANTRFDWRIFAAIAAVMLVFNLIWPVA